MNTLPKEWCVKNDGTKLFIDTVIPWLRKNGAAYDGSSMSKFYGWGGIYPHLREREWGTLLTIQQFIDMTTESFSPKEGDIVEVRSENVQWVTRTFISKVKDIILCVYPGDEDKYRGGRRFAVSTWTEMRPIPKKEPILIHLNTEYSVKVDEMVHFGCNHQYLISINVIQQILDAHKEYNKQ